MRALTAASLAFAIMIGAVPVAAKTLRVVLASPLVEEGSGPNSCTPAVSGLGGPADWEVRVERLLLDGKALVETSHEARQGRFPLCIADLPVAKNAEVELPFVIRDGGVARAAGILLRFTDPQDYYVAEADAAAGQVRLVRVLNGERREIARRTASLVTGKAYTLKARIVGERFAVVLDGKPLFKAHDSGIDGSGRFGIWSRADSRTRFGDLFIAVLD